MDRYNRLAKEIIKAEQDLENEREIRKLEKALIKAQKRKQRLPFIGLDGEGWGKDSVGRQNYMMMCSSHEPTSVLYTGERLTTYECLEFILEQPKEGILVGFSFGYDISMILRDLTKERVDKLFEKKERGPGKSLYTYFGDYALEYLPGQFFKVARCRDIKMEDGSTITEIIKGTNRTVWEVFGFYQCKFIKALADWKIGTDYLEMVSTMKDARDELESQKIEDIEFYCRSECRLLAQLLEALRTACEESQIVPRSWNGAGKLAAALHNDHESIKRKDVEMILPKQVQQWADMAYYGGRFEITKVGKIKGPIYENDINSAYPDGMDDLPCLVHGKWKHLKGRAALKATGLYLAKCTFDHPNDSYICGLPIRSKSGHLYWPRRGRGVYWSCEIESTRMLGGTVKCSEAWVYEKHCDCNPLAWVKPLYEFRKSLGKATRGYPIKLGLNSLYGKFAQRIGSAPWRNPLWAGLITSRTRAKLGNAASQAPESIVMMATDGIYSTKPLNLPVSDKLGEWECNEYESIFVIQPGLYECSSGDGDNKVKSRGISKGAIKESLPVFISMWDDFVAEANLMSSIGVKLPEAPKVPVKVRLFTGLRLAQSRGKPHEAGKWEDKIKVINMDWRLKRNGGILIDDAIITRPRDGDLNLESVTYSDEMVGHSDTDPFREDFFDQPDGMRIVE